MKRFRIACLCPTYKRPEHLRNALACFLNQRYSLRESRLFILDDAIAENEKVQHDPQMGDNWELHTSKERYANLPAKYNKLVELAEWWEPDAYAIWEDDDVFLPYHLVFANEAFNKGIRFYRTAQVWSNYNMPKGKAQLEGAEGRFHSSWVFTKQALNQIGGWPKTERLDFDQQLGAKLRDLDSSKSVKLPCPQYVYRWGNGVYHGSQAGEEGFKSLWDRLGEMKVPYVGTLVPTCDEETVMLMQNLRI